MATEVYTTEEIKLQNGESVVLRPLSIKGVRKFMTKFKEFQTLDEVEGVDPEMVTLDILVDLTAICLERDLPELAKDKDALEDALDQQTIYKIIEICGGIKLNDPKLLETAAALTVNHQVAGTN